jgi:hypothetical protein
MNFKQFEYYAFLWLTIPGVAVPGGLILLYAKYGVL